MAKSNTRLELTWIGKENRPRLEPRILIEEPEKSYHAKFRWDDLTADDADQRRSGRKPKKAEKDLDPMLFNFNKDATP